MRRGAGGDCFIFVLFGQFAGLVLAREFVEEDGRASRFGGLLHRFDSPLFFADLAMDWLTSGLSYPFI